MKNRKHRVRRKRKSILSFILLLFLVASLYFVVNALLLIKQEFPTGGNQLTSPQKGAESNFHSKQPNKQQEPSKQKEQGSIVVVNVDGDTELPITGTEYVLIDLSTQELVEVLHTDELGRGTSGLLELGNKYILRQQSISSPYQLDKTEYQVEIKERNQELITQNNIPEFVQGYERLENGQLRLTEVYIPVETVLQLPELPNGCEITALTAVLNTYGYDVSKLIMADEYLPKEPFKRVNGKLYGANPYEAYAGDPWNKLNGFFSYAPPIIKAGQDYLATVGGQEKPLDISGSSPEEILAYLDQGIPVVIWVTLDLSKPRINYSWYFRETNEKFLAPVNLHCVVLHGYTEKEVHVMDPLKGLLSLDRDKFFASYDDLGTHALVVIQD